MGTLFPLARQHLSWPPCLPSMSPVLSSGGSQAVSSSDRLPWDALLQREAFRISRRQELAVMEKNTSRGNVCCLKCHLLVHKCIGNMIISGFNTIQSCMPINFWKVESYFNTFPSPRKLLLNMSAHSPSIHFLRKTPNTQHDSLCALFLLLWSKKMLLIPDHHRAGRQKHKFIKHFLCDTPHYRELLKHHSYNDSTLTTDSAPDQSDLAGGSQKDPRFPVCESILIIENL